MFMLCVTRALTQDLETFFVVCGVCVYLTQYTDTNLHKNEGSTFHEVHTVSFRDLDRR
jgi:hypothetical protein